jgi:peptide/nickel transport system ATP-binding protein
VNDLLQVEDLVRHYPVRVPGGWFGRPATLRAVDGISFSLAPGRTLGLVGESGCGKSTTARLVLGLLPPTSGSVKLEGQEVPARRTAAWRSLRRRMQMVYQDPLGALDRRMSVIRQVMEPMVVFRIGTSAEQQEKAASLLADVGLGRELHHRFPHELSGGQRQRVVLARALILEPALLVCDEPVSALDVSIQAQVINLLSDIQQRFGVAMLFISHDLKVVRQISGEVAVMYLGRIVEQGEPEVLFRRPAHPYTQALVAAIPSPWRKAGFQRIVLKGDPPDPVQEPVGCAFHRRCPFAMPVCLQEAPVLTDAAPGHRVACHLVNPLPN